MRLFYTNLVVGLINFAKKSLAEDTALINNPNVNIDKNIYIVYLPIFNFLILTKSSAVRGTSVG